MTNYRLLNDGEGSRRPISVGTWIPTAERMPEPPDRNVIVQHYMRSESVNPSVHIAWQEMPEPYVAPEPKRRRGWFKPNRLDHFKQSQDTFEAIEVLPGDPNPDVTLEVVEEMGNVYKSMPQLTCLSTWIKRIEESRSK